MIGHSIWYAILIASGTICVVILITAVLSRIRGTDARIVTTLKASDLIRRIADEDLILISQQLTKNQRYVKRLEQRNEQLEQMLKNYRIKEQNQKFN